MEGPMRKGKVQIIGVSPEGAGSLGTAARAAIKRAQQVYGGERLLKLFSFPHTEATVIKDNLPLVVSSIKANLGIKRMVVLASGDPGFFGIARYLGEKLGREAIEITPAVSSMQYAFARIKENWEDATFTSVHSRPIEKIIETVMSSHKIAILTDHKNTPRQIAGALLAAGIDDCRVHICQDLGTAGERIVSTNLMGVSQMKLSALCVMILLRDYLPAAHGAQQLLGIVETGFHQRKKGSLITKHEIRAVSLAKMRLTDSSVIWDIGAGSGSVSIEASLLAGKGVVYAIEKNSAAAAIIRLNIKRFKRRNIKLIQAHAPFALDELPEPTAVFIGGSGGKLSPILDCVCGRLTRDGWVVCNLATMENVNLAADRLKANGFTAEITLVNVARSRDIAGLTRLEPLNPIFIVAGSRSVENSGHKKQK